MFYHLCPFSAHLNAPQQNCVCLLHGGLKSHNSTPKQTPPAAAAPPTLHKMTRSDLPFAVFKTLVIISVSADGQLHCMQDGSPHAGCFRGREQAMPHLPSSLLYLFVNTTNNKTNLNKTTYLQAPLLLFFIKMPA